MLKIGLVIADENEIHNTNHFKLIKKHFNGNFFVFEFGFYEHKIYLIHSQIGLVNAALATQYLIDNFDLDQIWNYGAVGSTGKYQLFDIVYPTKYYYFDAITPWYPRGQIPGEKPFFESKKINQDQIDVSIGSGNSFINNKKYIDSLLKEINIDLIDMESCAIAQTCYKNKISFYCIKAVSDVIGKERDNLGDTNERIKKASQLAFDQLISSLFKLINKN